MENNENSISPNVSVLWQDVKADVEQKIISGEYAAGERIPSIRKIADSYNISLSTAQKVLQVLRQEDIIESKRGVGYYVKPYIREKLLTERKKQLEKMVQLVSEEAAMIGVDIVTMIKRYTGEV